MFDLALQESDFVGRELEEGVDAVVQFGFGLPTGQAFDGFAEDPFTQLLPASSTKNVW